MLCAGCDVCCFGVDVGSERVGGEGVGGGEKKGNWSRLRRGRRD